MSQPVGGVTGVVLANAGIDQSNVPGEDIALLLPVDPDDSAMRLRAGLAAGEWVVYAGTANALSFATQINKVETMRSEMTFAQLLRGLQVYGYKVLDNTSIAQAIINVG